MQIHWKEPESPPGPAIYQGPALNFTHYFRDTAVRVARLEGKAPKGESLCVISGSNSIHFIRNMDLVHHVEERGFANA